jgi:hypothetical protein
MFLVGNNYEFDRPFRKLTPVTGCADLCVFRGGDGKTIAMPFPLADGFLEDLSGIFGWKRTKVAVPVVRSSSISHDIYQDPACMAALEEQAFEGQIELRARGITRQFLELVANLSRMGYRVHGDVVRPGVIDLIEYFESKSGSRQLFQQLGIEVASGGVYGDQKQVLRAVTSRLKSTGGCVLKENHGLAGERVQLLRSIDDVTFRQDCEWPVIVEEYVRDADGCASMLLTYNGFIDKDEIFQSFGAGRQVTESSRFLGNILGKGALDSFVSRRVEVAGEKIGLFLAKIGYRGWFNVDFIAVDGGSRMIGCEINLRRSSSAALLEIGRGIAGDGWVESLALVSNEAIPVGPSLRTYSDLRRRLGTLLGWSNTWRGGIVPLLVSPLPVARMVGLAAYADSVAGASALLAEAARLVSH